MSAGALFSSSYKRYALAAMTTVYTLNILDRGLMIMLLQPIKEELQLSDTQLGFLTGIVFGLFYAVLGVPIARWADRGNRVTITSLAIGLWSLTVMACLFVTNFAQLVAARIAAAVGEAGGQPPTYSLLGDYFPQPAERTSAMYVYQAASPLATLVSFALAGWLNELYGWRHAFFLVSIPGLLLAVLIKWTLVEPRVSSAGTLAPPTKAPPMKAVLSVLWHQSSCRHLTIGMVLLFTLLQGVSPWYAAFLIRSHGMGTAELGIWMGLVFGLSGLAGLVVGSYVVSRWFNGDERGQMRMTAMAVAGVIPFFISFLILPDRYLALFALVPQTIVLSAFLSPPFALLQRLVPDEMRATALMVMMLLANLIGMGLGPQLVGVLSDLLEPLYGPDALRYAMLSISLLAFAAALHFWRVSRTIEGDLLIVASHGASA